MATYRVPTVEKLSAKCVIGGMGFRCLAIRLNTEFTGRNYYAPTETYSSIEGSLPIAVVEGQEVGFMPIRGDWQYDTSHKFYFQRSGGSGIGWGYNNGSDHNEQGVGTSGYNAIIYPLIYLDNNDNIIFVLTLKYWTERETPTASISPPSIGQFGYFVYDINGQLPTGGYSSNASATIRNVFTYSDWTTDPYAQEDGEGDISGGASGGASGGVHIPGFPGLTATDTGIIGLFAPSTSQIDRKSVV